MKKESGIIFVLIGVIILVGIFAVFNYIKMNSEIDGLKKTNSDLLTERGQLKDEIESYKAKIAKTDAELAKLQEDVAKIYKTCITNNACKGHYPGISWNCNNVGDEVSDPSHTCVCDSACNLKATAI